MHLPQSLHIEASDGAPLIVPAAIVIYQNRANSVSPNTFMRLYCSVNVVDALINSISYLPGCPLLIDRTASRLPLLLRKAHTPKSKNRKFVSRSFHPTV